MKKACKKVFKFAVASAAVLTAFAVLYRLYKKYLQKNQESASYEPQDLSENTKDNNNEQPLINRKYVDIKLDWTQDDNTETSETAQDTSESAESPVNSDASFEQTVQESEAGNGITAENIVETSNTEESDTETDGVEVSEKSDEKEPDQETSDVSSNVNYVNID